MRKILTILLLLPVFLSAKNIYFSNAGDDNFNNGTQFSPYATINKLNLISATVVAGDSVLFRRGDIFFGSIKPTNGGGLGSRIVFGAWGTGAKPVITGFITLTGWTNITGNIWETNTNQLKLNVNVLTINGLPQQVGRQPNTGFYYYQSATASTLTSSYISGNLLGRQVVIQKKSWLVEKANITAQSGNTITYVNNDTKIDNNDPRPPEAGDDSLGFFFQRDISYVDAQGEWFYTGSKVRIFSTVNPNALSIKASAIDTLIILDRKSNITITDLTFEGANVYGTFALIAQNITTKNCSFINNTRGSYNWNILNVVVDNNTFDYSLNNAILCTNRQNKQITITNNRVTNTGTMLGMGAFASDNNLKAIVGETNSDSAGNFVRIANNYVRNTGSGGIIYQGSNVLIENNYVDTMGTQMGDIGFIYSFVNNTASASPEYVNRVIRNNIILNAMPTRFGAKGIIDIAGLYCDARVSNIDIYGNTIINVPGNGLQISTSHNIKFHDNTIFNCNVGLGLLTNFYGTSYGNIIKRNIIYQKDSTQHIVLHQNGNLLQPTPKTITQSIQQIADMDSNWISNLKYRSYMDFYSGPANPLKLSYYPLTQWRDSFNHDRASVLPPVAYTGSNVRIVYNPSDTVLNVSFYGQKKITPDSKVYENSVNVPRWGSVLLIDNGASAAPNQRPTAIIANIADPTLPTSQVTLTSISTDPEGPINIFSWSKMSGTGGAITNSTASTTTFTNLSPGPYQVRLIVTDNGGLKDTTYKNFFVNPAVVPPNVPPTVTVRPNDTTLTLPSNSVTLRASPRDSDGTIVSTVYTQTSGPSCTIVTPNDSVTVVNNLVEGSYNLLVTTTDNSGATATANIHIVVNPAPVNTVPVAQAGRDTSFKLPVTSTALSGTGTATTPGATITGYSWTLLSGPGGSSFGSTGSATTTFTATADGTYVIRFTVTDSNSLTAQDDVEVIVYPAPSAGIRPRILFRTILKP